MLGAFGLKASDFPDDDFEVWPANWPAIELYAQYRTQWIQGPGGPTGLNYTVLFTELDRRGIEGEERDDVMGGIQVIESEVLNNVYGGK